MFTNATIRTSPTLPTPVSAWEANSWPEYLPVRYWHDLAYNPSQQPLYPFVRSGNLEAAAPLRRTGAQIQEQRTCSEQERQWRKVQEYWWNRSGGQLKDAGDVGGEVKQTEGSRAGGRESARTTVLLIAEGGRETLQRLVRCVVVSPKYAARLGLGETTKDLFGILLGLLGLLLFLSFAISIAVLIGAALFILVDGLSLQKYGELERVPPFVWYENVPCFRSWSVAPQRWIGPVASPQDGL